MTCFPGNQVDCVSFSLNRMFKKRKLKPGFHLLFHGGGRQSKLAIGRDDSGCTAASGKVAGMRTAAPREVCAAYGRLRWPGAAPQARPLFCFFFVFFSRSRSLIRWRCCCLSAAVTLSVLEETETSRVEEMLLRPASLIEDWFPQVNSCKESICIQGSRWRQLPSDQSCDLFDPSRRRHLLPVIALPTRKHLFKVKASKKKNTKRHRKGRIILHNENELPAMFRRLNTAKDLISGSEQLPRKTRTVRGARCWNVRCSTNCVSVGWSEPNSCNENSIKYKVLFI